MELTVIIPPFGRAHTGLRSDRPYTHAYLALCVREGWSNAWRVSGFTTSAMQAAKEMEAETIYYTRWGATVVFSEIVEVEMR
jgi:hypothetical protein